MPITGLNSALGSIKKFPEAFKTGIRTVLFDSGNAMVKEARRSHAFNRKSGNTDRSIKKKVSTSKIHLEFFMDDQMTTVRSKKGTYSTGVLNHEGTYNGYKRSKSAPLFSNTKGPNGIYHDHFMDDAWDKEIPKMLVALDKSVVESAKKVGL